MRFWKIRGLALLLGLALIAGCQGGTTSQEDRQKSTDSVIIAMGPTSEPEAGFDPAFGWGAGEHVHEPLIQSPLLVTNTVNCRMA